MADNEVMLTLKRKTTTTTRHNRPHASLMTGNVSDPLAPQLARRQRP